MEILFLIIGGIASILFIGCTIPEIIQHFKAKKLQGTSKLASLIICLGILCTIISSFYFGNYILAIGDCIALILNLIILILRIKKS